MTIFVASLLAVAFVAFMAGFYFGALSQAIQHQHNPNDPANDYGFTRKDTV